MGKSSGKNYISGSAVLLENRSMKTRLEGSEEDEVLVDE